jgi:DNA mismatch repair ATPase MutS
MEMRNKAGAQTKKQDKDKDARESKIVKRELRQIFTNGTIVDPEYLQSDEANHCVAIKVGQASPGYIHGGSGIDPYLGILHWSECPFFIRYLHCGCLDRGIQPVLL